MTETENSASPGDDLLWSFKGADEMRFSWSYFDTEESDLLALYERAKKRQWDAASRLDWSEQLDPENPMQLSEALIPIHGSNLWSRLSAKERRLVQVHSQAHSISQFLHGEQGALLAASRLVQSLPDMDAKLFAATQVVDEARHVETYARLLREKFPVSYGIDPSLQTLLMDGLSQPEWDMALLTMQVLVENVALASFQRIRDNSGTNLATAVNAYIMQDEARHVAFGRLALRGFYSQMTDAERARREDFVLESLHQIRLGFLQREVWSRLGLPVEQCVRLVGESKAARDFLDLFLSRVVPVFSEIGLWSARLRKEFEPLGGNRYAQINLATSLAADESFADALAAASSPTAASA